MKLIDLSDLILLLTHSAIEHSPADHQSNLINILRSVVQFDGAWWGWAILQNNRDTIIKTRTFNLPQHYESAFREVMHDDPFIRKGRNLTVFTKSISSNESDLTQSFRDFLNAFGIDAVLNGHCRLQGETDTNFFMSVDFR